MKVYHPSEKLTSLKTQILQLQLTLELSQIQEILSAYSDLLLFFAEYSFLFINDSTETPVLNDKHSNFEGCFITQDLARDGSNWWVYCNNNTLIYLDPTGLSTTLDDYAYQLRTQSGKNTAYYYYSYTQETNAAIKNQGYSPDGKWNNYFCPSIEKNIKQLFNLDYGKDYINDAKYSFSNRLILQGIIQELDATGEMILDVGAALYLSEAIPLFIKNTSIAIIQPLSIQNKKSDYMTLGKNFDGGPMSYITKAKNTGDTYFNMGKLWNPIQKLLGVSNDDMFNVFNKPALDYAVMNNKTIRFTVDPSLEIYKGSFTAKEWQYLQTEYGYKKLIQEGEYWYAVKVK